MGSILCKCFGNCFGGGGERPSSAADVVTEPLVSVHNGFGEGSAQTSSTATDVTKSFVYTVTPKRFSSDHNTLGSIEEFKLELSENPQLNPIIEGYLMNSIYTHDFLSSIEECLKEALSSADLLLEAVNDFETGKPTSSVLELLEQFKAQGNTFPQTFVHYYFKSERDHQFSVVRQLLELVNNLDRELGKVSCWKVVGSSVYTVATVGWLIGSAVLVIMSSGQVKRKDFDPGHKAFEQLNSDINVMLDEHKSSLKYKRDPVVELLKQAIGKLISVKPRQTSRDIEDLNGIKERVHKHMQDYMESVADENTGFGMEVGYDEDAKGKTKTATAMDGIKTEAGRLKTIVENLKEEVNRRRDDLSTAVATILKAVQTNKNEFVCCCCCCCC